jgi:hypothetical protein
MYGKMYNIKISSKSNTNNEQKRLLQQEIKYQQLLIISKLKKFLKDGTPFTGDLRKTFPEYYNKCFILIKKKPNNDFVFFKYYTDDGKGDDEESKDSQSDEESEDDETKDLLLKEIELMFQNGYTYEDAERIFPSFYKANSERINLLFTHVLDIRFNRDPTLTIQKVIDIHKSRQDQTETIEKRRRLRKAIRKS